MTQPTNSTDHTWEEDEKGYSVPWEFLRKQYCPGIIRLFKYLTKDMWNLSGAFKLKASRIVKQQKRIKAKDGQDAVMRKARPE